MKAVADVAHAGEQMFGSLDRARSRTHIGSILLGVGLGVGLGALLFSESARQQVRTWLAGPTVAVRVQGNGAAHAEPTIDTTAEATAEAHDEAPAH
jgi:hypothetical protein